MCFSYIFTGWAKSILCHPQQFKSSWFSIFFFMPSVQLCLQIMFIQAKLHLFQLAGHLGHFTSFSVWRRTTSKVWVWTCACASCCVFQSWLSRGCFLHPRKKKTFKKEIKSVQHGIKSNKWTFSVCFFSEPDSWAPWKTGEQIITFPR